MGEFDYLSTVSGGGYIGAWLQVLIRQCGGVAGAVDVLGDTSRPGSALRTLRNYTSYLSPESGFLSADLWTNVVLYLRNVLLNLLVFLPILLTAVIAPVLLRTFIWAIHSWPWGQDLLLVVVGIALAFATYWSALGLPNHRLKPGHHGPAENPARDAMPTRAICWQIYIPFLVWAFLAPATLPDGDPPWAPMPMIVLAYAAALWSGFAAAGIRGVISRSVSRVPACSEPTSSPGCLQPALHQVRSGEASISPALYRRHSRPQRWRYSGPLWIWRQAMR